MTIQSSAGFDIFTLALSLWKTGSQNVEPERRHDLHWHLWGHGVNGHGLLRLLVSKTSKTSAVWFVKNLFGSALALRLS